MVFGSPILIFLIGDMDSKHCYHDQHLRLHVVAIIGPVVRSLASRIMWTWIPIPHTAYTTVDGSEIYQKIPFEVGMLSHDL